ncbi:MAG TPA: glucokinase [Blastocatellia bacterium]|nr:glucokinase [Blastocatellia bacterium]
MILAGDIGGTKTNLALFDTQNDKLHLVEQRSFKSNAYMDLEAILKEFIAEFQPTFTAAAFGVAGPVLNGRVEATNLPWIINAGSLANLLKLSNVGLINDLEANAYGIPLLGPEEFIVLNEGDKTRTGNAGLISAGTGLGTACMFWDGQKHVPSASEGGHQDFSPNGELQVELLRYLMRQFGHVSIERVISGIGFLNIYKFLKDYGYADEPEWLAKEMTQGDPNAVITKAALERKSELCMKTLDLFVSAYGAEAGNLALVVKALGGLYVGGGIAPKIIDKMKDGTFMGAFTDKGRLTGLMATIPVKVIMNDKTALIGAASYAQMYC